MTGNSRELPEQEVRPLIEAFLNERGLWLSPEKTKITHASEGFDFLGQNIRSHNGVVLVTPSKKNTLAFPAKIRERINANKGATHENLIRVLSPVIRGWANYPTGHPREHAQHEIFRLMAEHPLGFPGTPPSLRRTCRRAKPDRRAAIRNRAWK